MALGAALCVASGGWAQSDELSRSLERADEPAPEIAPMGAEPVADAALEPEALDLRPSPGDLVREGAVLRDRRGRIVRAGSGDWVFVFDPDASGRAEPPMVLLPCARLGEITRLIASRNRTLTFLVTGTVFAYRGQNYLLPTAHTTIEAEDPVDRAETSVEQVPATDPSADDLIESLQRGARPQGARAAPAPAQADADRPVLREGATIMSRVGRVLRSADGSLVFTSDNGAGDESGESGGSFRLMPSLNLQGIERLLAERGEGIKLSLSGQVYVHDRVNHLLVTVYRLVIDRDGNTVASH